MKQVSWVKKRDSESNFLIRRLGVTTQTKNGSGIFKNSNDNVRTNGGVSDYDDGEENDFDSQSIEDNTNKQTELNDDTNITTDTAGAANTVGNEHANTTVDTTGSADTTGTPDTAPNEDNKESDESLAWWVGPVKESFGKKSNGFAICYEYSRLYPSENLSIWKCYQLGEYVYENKMHSRNCKDIIAAITKLRDEQNLTDEEYPVSEILEESKMMQAYENYSNSGTSKKARLTNLGNLENDESEDENDKSVTRGLPVEYRRRKSKLQGL